MKPKVDVSEGYTTYYDVKQNIYFWRPSSLRDVTDTLYELAARCRKTCYDYRMRYKDAK